MLGKLLNRGKSSSARTRRAVIKRSRQQEKRTAQASSAGLVSGSGNQWHSKGDVKTKRLLIECKQTAKESYSLKLHELQKIQLEALKAGRTPVMALDIAGRDFVVLRKTDFEELLDD